MVCFDFFFKYDAMDLIKAIIRWIVDLASHPPHARKMHPSDFCHYAINRFLHAQNVTPALFGVETRACVALLHPEGVCHVQFDCSVCWGLVCIVVFL